MGGGLPRFSQSFLHRYNKNFLDLMENEKAVQKLLKKCNSINAVKKNIEV